MNEFKLLHGILDETHLDKPGIIKKDIHDKLITNVYAALQEHCTVDVRLGVALNMRMVDMMDGHPTTRIRFNVGSHMKAEMHE